MFEIKHKYSVRKSLCVLLYMDLIYHLSGILTSKASDPKEIKQIQFFKHVTRKNLRGSKIMKLFFWIKVMKETLEITCTYTSVFYWS